MYKLLQKAEEAGITVLYCDIPCNKSISIEDDHGDFVLMDYSLSCSDVSGRVHLAHEIGHSMTGAFYNPYAACDIRKKHENRADKWAIKQLIPREAFQFALDRGISELWELAEYFNVTEDFMKKAACYYMHGNLATELYFESKR